MPWANNQALQTNLFYDDLDACAQFYERLGLRSVLRASASDQPEHVEVEAAGVRIGLTSAAASNRLAALGAATSGSVSTEVVHWVDDVESLHEVALEDPGASFRTRGEARAAVKEFVRGVEVAEMPGSIFDHVKNDPAQIVNLVVRVSAVPPDRVRFQRRGGQQGIAPFALLSIEGKHFRNRMRRGHQPLVIVGP